jgi:D-alanine-D-alanine ligase
MTQPQNLFVYVIAPLVVNANESIDYYYDYTQSIAEYAKAFEELNIAWKWQPVTLHNFEKEIEKIAFEKIDKQKIIFNLCDGDEVNGSPGISVIHILNKFQLIYSGANAFFYTITTSKIPMKKAFDLANVCTPAWAIMNQHNNANEYFEQLGTPLIIKPAVSGGSMGVSVKSVVHTASELMQQYNILTLGYQNYNLLVDGAIVESFIIGQEYTTFIIGNYNNKEKAIIYTPVERVFHTALPAEEQFLSYDRLWETYDTEKPIADYEDFYNYQLPPPQLIEKIKQISWDAYEAVQGTGYGRVDIRMCAQTKQLYVLEVNAQCGISDDENYTSIGAILRLTHNSFSSAVLHIINNAMENLK